MFAVMLTYSGTSIGEKNGRLCVVGPDEPHKDFETFAEAVEALAFIRKDTLKQYPDAEINDDEGW